MPMRAKARKRRAMVLGAAVLIFFVALVGLSLISQHGLPFAPRTTVKAAFDDVGSLRPGDDVRIANVRVGYVQDIGLVEAADPKSGAAKQAVATLRLDNERPVYNNAQVVTVSVGARSSLGQKFVELNPGNPSAGLLPADHVISTVQSVGAQDLSDVLRVLDLPTRQAIGSTVRNVGGGLAGHSEDLHAAFSALPNLLPDLGNVSMALANNKGRDFSALLVSANELSKSFAGRQQEIGQTLGKLDKTFAGFNADNGKALGDTLQAAPDSLRATKAALDSLNGPLDETATAAKGLEPGGEALGQATPDFRGFLNDSPEPLDKVPGVSDDAQPAFEDLDTSFDKLQPLTPMLGRTFGRGGALAQVLSPYSPEASLFFTNATKALQEGNDNFHWLNIVAKINGTENLTDTSGGLIRDPLQTRDPRPKPGESAKQVRGLGLPGLGGGN
jgi:phospholipid/cholesterol/gamma-HCH transport system substrate-binding protein